MTRAAPRSLAWRIIHHPMMLLVIAIMVMIVANIAAAFAGKAILQAGSADGPLSIVASSVAALIVFLAYAAFCRFVEQRPVREFALSGAVVELGAGLLIGVLLFCAVVAIIWEVGSYRVIGYGPASVLFSITGIAIISGITEEIMLRGVFFRLIEQWLGSWIALILSAALFGALHLGNPNATLVAGAAIALEAGVMLAAVYMVTRRLWAAIGLHAAWNFTQGGIFGIAVSGNDTPGLLRPMITGPDWVTGGAFGAEASLPAVIVCTGFGIAALVVAVRRGHVVKPFWSRAQGDFVQS